MAANQPKRILVVDDHPMVRQSLVFAVSAVPAFQVVGSVNSGHDAIRLCPVTQPDMIIMDAQMPGMDGLEATRIIHALDPDIKIVVFTSFEVDTPFHDAATEAGAVACVNKQTPLTDIMRLLETLTQ